MIISNKITEKKKILNLFSKEELTSKQISEKLGIKIENIYVYISELKKDNKICIISDSNGKNVYFMGKPIEYLKFLNDFFKENVEFLMKNNQIKDFILENEELFNKIERVIINA